MPKVAITMSDALHAKLKAMAERDAPGNPNLSATGLRLLALGVAQEEAVRPLGAAVAALVQEDVGGSVADVPSAPAFLTCPRCGQLGRPSEARPGALACAQLHRWDPATGTPLP